MKASVIDLRYKMSEILSALDRNESVEILYHGRTRGIIRPVIARTEKKVNEHPFFGMTGNEKESVDETMETLRGQR